MQRITIQLADATDEPRRLISREAIITKEQPGLIIPQDLALILRLEELDMRFFNTVDGDAIQIPHVGPVFIQMTGHNMICSALVWGKDVRIGANLLEAMGWEHVVKRGWMFTDKPLRLPTILPIKPE